MRGCAIEKRGIGRIGKRLPFEFKDGKILHEFNLISGVEELGITGSARPFR
jgi:hypothetical protein